MEWQDKIQTRKGNVGEAIVHRFLESKGLTIYQPVTNQAHPVDRIVANRDHSNLRMVEIKSYPRRIHYPDTGIDARHYYSYVEKQALHNIPLSIYFVDEDMGKIYGGRLDYISQEIQVEHRGKKINYPLFQDCHKGKKVYFHIDLMTTIADLTHDERMELDSLSTRNSNFG